MKKKGLIISTVVMVVVLIAALTTTTFAWFSADASATVTDIQLGAKSATSMSIGVVSEGTVTTVPTEENKVRNGQDISWSSKWQGGTEGLGPNIQFSLSMQNLTQAVSIATEKVDEKFDIGDFFKAYRSAESENAVGTYDKTNAEKATVNGDYFDATFVAMPTKSFKQAYVKITVTADDPNNIGMAAAIHFGFYGDNGKLIDASTGIEGETTLSSANSIGAFDGLQQTSSWKIDGSNTGKLPKDEASKTATEKGQTERTESAATWTYYVPLFDFTGSGITAQSNYLNTACKLIRIVAWIEGTDESCVNETTGTSGSIQIEFVSSETQKYFKNGRLFDTDPNAD